MLIVYSRMTRVADLCRGSLVMDRIKREAKVKGINLSDPMHAFTVWADYPNQVVYHGSFVTHSEAGVVAAELASLKRADLYIAMGPLSAFSVYEV
jgi:hypothetical protein